MSDTKNIGKIASITGLIFAIASLLIPVVGWLYIAPLAIILSIYSANKGNRGGINIVVFIIVLINFIISPSLWATMMIASTLKYVPIAYFGLSILLLYLLIKKNRSDNEKKIFNYLMIGIIFIGLLSAFFGLIDSSKNLTDQKTTNSIGNDISSTPQTKLFRNFQDGNMTYKRNSRTISYYSTSDIGADITTFKTIGESKYGIDKNSVWCDGRKMSADTATFGIFSTETPVYYGGDKEYVYYGCDRIEGVDAKSFTLLRPLSGKDKDHIITDGKIVSGADPETYKSMPTEDGKDTGIWGDKDGIFYDGKKIDGIDRTTFEIIGTGPSGYTFTKDKNMVYKFGYDRLFRPIFEIIKGADPQTFIIPKE